jgi:hypothetical protein
MDPVIHLLHACGDGDLAQVKDTFYFNVNVTFYFLPHDDANREILDATPLLIAAGNGHVNVCQYLVGLGASNVNYQSSIKSESGQMGKFSPLHWVIVSCSSVPTFLETKVTIEFLLANGADLSIPPVVNGISRPIMLILGSRCAFNDTPHRPWPDLAFVTVVPSGGMHSASSLGFMGQT